MTWGLHLLAQLNTLGWLLFYEHWRALGTFDAVFAANIGELLAPLMLLPQLAQHSMVGFGTTFGNTQAL